MKLFKEAVVLSLVGGYILGKAGETIFAGERAKKAYTAVATGAFIGKDMVMEQVEKIQASAADIAEEAKAKAERYYEKKDAAYEEAQKSDDDVFAEVVEDILEPEGEEA